MGDNRKLILRALKYPMKIWYFYIPSLLFFAAQDIILILYTVYIQSSILDALQYGQITDIPRILVRLLLIYFISLCVIGLGMALIDYSNIHIQNIIKSDLFMNIFRQDRRFCDNIIASSDLNVRIMNDSSQIAYFFTYQIGGFFMPALKILGCIIVLSLVDVLFGIAAIVCCIIILIYTKAISPKIKEISRKLQESNVGFLHKLNILVKAAESLKLLKLEDEKAEEADTMSRTIYKLSIKQAYFDLLRSLLCNGFQVFLLCVILVWCIFYKKPVMPLSSIMLMPLLLGYVFSSISEFTANTFNSQQAFVSIERVFEVMDLNNGDGAKISNNMNTDKALIVESVSKTYDNGRGLKPISFEVLPNSIICIKGEVGTGKSTLIKILLGLEKKDSGRISVFSYDQEETSYEDWLSMFSYVEQQPALFRTSILENIVFDKENIDKDRFEEVVRVTDIGKMISTTKNGFDAIIGEEGLDLSGGQKQLICFARALYSNAPIIILDEYSSALDEETESRLTKIIQELSNGSSHISKTILIISHKEWYQSFADKIIQMI